MSDMSYDALLDHRREQEAKRTRLHTTLTDGIRRALWDTYRLDPDHVTVDLPANPADPIVIHVTGLTEATGIDTVE